MHSLVEPDLDNAFSMNGIENLHEDHFGTSPDYLGKSVQRLYEYVRKFL